MRNFTILAVIVLALVVGGAVLRQKTASKRADSAPACAAEIALLDLWSAQRLVEYIGRDGNDIVVKVDTQRWRNIHRHAQVKIGHAAYCRLGLIGDAGTARIVGTYGDELARVAGGKWSSKLYPE